MNQLEIKVTPINLTPQPGQSVRYRCLPKNTRVYSYEEILNMTATRTGLPLSTIRYVDELKHQIEIDLLANNSCVHDGLCMMKLNITGSLASMSDQPTKEANPVKATLIPEGDIVNALKVIELINTTVTVAAIMNEVQESGLAESNKLTTANVNIAINGSCIEIDSTKTDEGVFLCDRTTGAILKTATVVSTDAAHCVVKFASLPTDGRYDLVLRTRNKMPGMDLASVSRIVTVENAE